jgi:hypothetical protein
MTAKKIAWRMMHLIWSKTIPSRIRNPQSSGMWVSCQRFPDSFGLHGSQRDRLNRCWWRSMQLKREGTRESRKSRTEYINVSPAALCITRAMKPFARHINSSPVRPNCARMLLRSASPLGEALRCQKDYQQVQIMMKTTVYGSRCWMDNTLK